MDIGTKKVSKYISAAFLVVLTLVACQSGDNAQNVLEESNVKKAVYCMELLEIKLDVETADRECFAKRYVQHVPYVPDGRDAVVSFFAARVVNYTESTIEIKRSAADGDMEVLTRCMDAGVDLECLVTEQQLAEYRRSVTENRDQVAREVTT
jgi:predicted SnoaL-like aldol condensation-catalyzing enzyme